MIIAKLYISILRLGEKKRGGGGYEIRSELIYPLPYSLWPDGGLTVCVNVEVTVASNFNSSPR